MIMRYVPIFIDYVLQGIDEDWQSMSLREIHNIIQLSLHIGWGWEKSYSIHNYIVFILTTKYYTAYSN